MFTDVSIPRKLFVSSWSSKEIHRCLAAVLLNNVVSDVKNNEYPNKNEAIKAFVYEKNPIGLHIKKKRQSGRIMWHQHFCYV
jgi:hypothetical protein